MSVFTGVVIGLIAGWLIEWVIDWVFWRRGDNELPARLAEAESKFSTLQVNNQQLNAQLTSAQDRVKELEAELEAYKLQGSQIVYQEKDALERINGIGKVFAQRLNAAGIFTFADLALTDPTQLEEIVGRQKWQKIDPESWIEQAQAFAHRNAPGAEASRL